jgi:hypothetical protein
MSEAPRALVRGPQIGLLGREAGLPGKEKVVMVAMKSPPQGWVPRNRDGVRELKARSLHGW